MLSKARDHFSILPRKQKWIVVGTLLSTLGLFLPWYSDLDQFQTGVTYFAVTGPASLVGISLVVLNLVTLALVAYASRFRREPFLPISRASLERWHGVIYLYGLLLIASIYLHSDFGVNISQKTVGIGMYVGGIGALVSTYAGFFFKNSDFAHINPSIVEDVSYEEDPVAREQWEKQRLLEEEMRSRSQQGLDTTLEPMIESEQQDTTTEGITIKTQL